MIRFITGVAMALAALLAAYLLEGGAPMTLLGLTAFLITFFVPLFGALAVWSLGEWFRAWGHAFRPSPRAEAQVSVEIWKFSEFACYLASILASLAGGVLISQSLAGADSTAQGRSFAALLVGPIYGVTFGYVCRILRARVEALMAK